MSVDHVKKQGTSQMKCGLAVTTEPVTLPEGECYAHIREEVSGKILWEGGPYLDAKSARWAAGRHLNRLQKRFDGRQLRD